VLDTAETDRFDWASSPRAAQASPRPASRRRNHGKTGRNAAKTSPADLVASTADGGPRSAKLSPRLVVYDPKDLDDHAQKIIVAICAIWRAFWSTTLAGVKLWETFWKDRIQLTTTYFLRARKRRRYYNNSQSIACPYSGFSLDIGMET
jgi:hypothetical protein